MPDPLQISELVARWRGGDQDAARDRRVRRVVERVRGLAGQQEYFTP